MRKALVVVGVIVGTLALLLWIATWFRDEKAVATSAAREWPGGMGTLDSVSREERESNAAAVKLAALDSALKEDSAIVDFVARETARGELTIGDPPAIPDVTAVRELLLSETVVWSRRNSIGDSVTSNNRGVQMRAGRALVASALAKARTGDATAWEDLRAAWNLARSLDGHTQMMEQTAALSIARMINAVAWKMPLPSPAWLAELQERDAVRPLLEAFRHQTAEYWRDGASVFPTRWLADSVEHDRLIAEKVFSNTSCAADVEMNKTGVDLSAIWRRALRYRAEREASANALRVREGKPIETSSMCSGGEWSFDGTTLRFSREIPAAPPDQPMPLELRIEEQ